MKLEIFWDVGSPYTYLATTQMAGLVKRTGAEVLFRPFLLGGVFKIVGNEMPALIAAKALYMQKDLARWRDRYGVKMLMPGSEVMFPINSLVPMRVAAAIEDPIEAERWCHAVMAAHWVEGADVGQADVVKQVIAKHGFDAGLMEAIARQEIKDRLRKNTDEAVERGAFGAPAMFVGSELYWGNDRLDFVEAALQAK